MSTASAEIVATPDRQTSLAEAVDGVAKILRQRPGGAEEQAPALKRESCGRSRSDLWDAILPPSLINLGRSFGLTGFERALVLLCCAVELDESVAALCAQAPAGSGRPYPTFRTALAVLPQPHWSALSPDGPLRRWRLIEVDGGQPLALASLRVDERILHHLGGVDHLDVRLRGYLRHVPALDELVPSHRRLAESIAQLWRRATAHAALPVVELYGRDLGQQLAIARGATALVGLELFTMILDDLPVTPQHRNEFSALWQREMLLRGCALLIDCHRHSYGQPVIPAAARRTVNELGGAVLVAAAERDRIVDPTRVGFAVSNPTRQEQRSLWCAGLGPRTGLSDASVEQLVAQFDFSAGAIRSVCNELLTSASDLGPADRLAPASSEARLWDACRRQARPGLDGLARRIEPRVTWDDIVLPERTMESLREIALQVRRRSIVYERWGLAKRMQRSLGITALFAGYSGTGKTLAAEVLASELRLDLYHIDLSQIVSKYIGETEKNLARIFDLAEGGSGILLFDEADALFGKRSEVKDSHDRYANIEVSYLLQRMEAYRGLAILTTNRKDALDEAFVRRLRSIVIFPNPDMDARTEIWRRIFPDDTPTSDLDFARLGQLNVSGGTIRNIATNAAFIAAQEGGSIDMQHILRAARREYLKLEKMLTSSEVEGWS